MFQIRFECCYCMWLVFIIVVVSSHDERTDRTLVSNDHQQLPPLRTFSKNVMLGRRRRLCVRTRSNSFNSKSCLTTSTTYNPMTTFTWTGTSKIQVLCEAWTDARSLVVKVAVEVLLANSPWKLVPQCAMPTKLRSIPQVELVVRRKFFPLNPSFRHYHHHQWMKTRGV